jgi:hypothetical protein
MTPGVGARPIRRTLSRLVAGVALAVVTTTGLLTIGAPVAQAAPATGSMFASNCPADLIQGQSNGCVTRLQNLLNAKAHAGLTADGSFGPATSTAVRNWQHNHHLTIDSKAGPATKKSLGDKPWAGSPIGGKISRTEVLNRSVNWINAKVPYSQSKYFPDAQGKVYRQDCSGFVSMSWHLKSSLTTVTLPQVATKIDKSRLQPGDILDQPGHHTVLFVGWADSAHTKINLRQESKPGTNAGQVNGRALSNYAGYGAYRYSKIN